MILIIITIIKQGYNVTIMAYGQTTSGKTFTMGTADDLSSLSVDPENAISAINSKENAENYGLITRFVMDLFENLKDNKEDGPSDSRMKVKVSFLEIYGEDVYDLIGIGLNKSGNDKPSLPVREDENGKVFVQGLHESEVDSAWEALNLLSTGCKNRITASTAMKSGSSRSHGIYTITLEQHFKSTSAEEDKHHMTSKLTFVDLAGSERIKKTCAEGQRLKEGIQINSGLFNLGQVINSLADDQKLKQGIKAIHIPYRNSKLTHLLKDALGGNSQTWFIACVSPAECNEIETMSTLTYAKQARNIQNKPVKNMDPMQVEIRRLKYMVKAWMSKAIHLKFGSSNNNHHHNNSDDCIINPNNIDIDQFESDLQHYTPNKTKNFKELIHSYGATTIYLITEIVSRYVTKYVNYPRELTYSDLFNNNKANKAIRIENMPIFYNYEDYILKHALETISQYPKRIWAVKGSIGKESGGTDEISDNEESDDE